MCLNHFHIPQITEEPAQHPVMKMPQKKGGINLKKRQKTKKRKRKYKKRRKKQSAFSVADSPRSNLKQKKFKSHNGKCEWCFLKKKYGELELHHINWEVDESSYIEVCIKKNGEKQFLYRMHKNGYHAKDTKLVCKACHEYIHSNSGKSEKYGFKKNFTEDADI